MRKPTAGLLVVLMLALPLASTASAQDNPARQSAAAQGPAPSSNSTVPLPPVAQAQPSAVSVSADELPISIARIRRELRVAQAPRPVGLRYDYHVDVVGKNPKVDFFKNTNLSPSGAVVYGGMTHQEFLNVVTPQEFRAPSGNVLSLAMLAIQQLTKKR